MNLINQQKLSADPVDEIDQFLEGLYMAEIWRENVSTQCYKLLMAYDFEPETLFIYHAFSS